MDIVMKLLIVASVVFMLRSSRRFQTMSRELDDTALSALRKMMRVSEDYGYPPSFIPILMLLTALCFMLSMYVTPAFVR